MLFGLQILDMLTHLGKKLIASELLRVFGNCLRIEMYVRRARDRCRNGLHSLFVKENPRDAAGYGFHRTSAAKSDDRPTARHCFNRNHSEVFFTRKNQRSASSIVPFEDFEWLWAKNRDCRASKSTDFLKHVTPAYDDQLQLHCIEGTHSKIRSFISDELANHKIVVFKFRSRCDRKCLSVDGRRNNFRIDTVVASNTLCDGLRIGNKTVHARGRGNVPHA